jgi:DNA-binding XRE family transcriptional regulator
MLRQAGLRLAALREAMGITQEQLAALLGVGRNTLAMWETGKNRPDPLALARAQQHGIPLEYVLLGLTRHVEHGHMAALKEIAQRTGAVLNGAVAEFPAVAATRGALSPRNADPAAPPRPPRRTLHEPSPRPRGFGETPEPLGTGRGAPGRPRRRSRATGNDPTAW